MALKKSKRQFKYSRNKVKLVRGGSEYFTLITELIENATDSVHLQTYIFESDETGQQVADALIAAAKRQVKVYMLVDGYASQSLPTLFIKSLLDAGIHFRYFEPVFKSRNFYFGRRLHSKVLVVDSRYALVGGVNITNRYNDMPGFPAWLDFALFAEGPVATEACNLCQTLWKGLQVVRDRQMCPPFPEVPKFEEEAQSLVRLRRNDWVRNKLQISNSYLEMFRTAKSEITILSSYALPGRLFRRKLESAVKRGVNVRMIISGRSDVIFVKEAERYWYDWLMRNNIEIYEYTTNVLHGKLASCDGEWMTIGSYNMNDLSAYASIELNFDVKDPVFVKKTDMVLQQIIDNDCIHVSRESYLRTSSVLRKFGRWFSYSVIRMALSLFTFYYRRDKK